MSDPHPKRPLPSAYRQALLRPAPLPAAPSSCPPSDVLWAAAVRPEDAADVLDQVARCAICQRRLDAARSMLDLAMGRTDAAAFDADVQQDNAPGSDIAAAAAAAAATNASPTRHRAGAAVDDGSTSWLRRPETRMLLANAALVLFVVGAMLMQQSSLENALRSAGTLGATLPEPVPASERVYRGAAPVVPSIRSQTPAVLPRATIDFRWDSPELGDTAVQRWTFELLSSSGQDTLYRAESLDAPHHQVAEGELPTNVDIVRWRATAHLASGATLTSDVFSLELLR